MSMHSILRRIKRLEAECLPTAAELEQARRLQERLEAGMRRVAEAEARGELEPHEPDTSPYAEHVRRQLRESALGIWKLQRARELKRRRR